MKIAVYGATGAIGSVVAQEARARGHEVTGISRRSGDAADELAGDALDPSFASEIAEKHDVIVSAIGPSRVSDDGTRFVDSIANLVATLGNRRLVVVGGAGSLKVDGVRLVDSSEFPEAYKDESLKDAASLDLLRNAADDVDWTYQSPAPVIAPGERTGSYKLGMDAPVGAQITIADFAVAMLDEIENPQHVRVRYTVAN